MNIWKDNHRNIHQNPIQRSISILIRIPITIQLCHISPSTPPPPGPFLVINPSECARQNSRHGFSSRHYLCHQVLPAPPCLHICHIVGFCIFIIAFSCFGVVQIFVRLTFLLPFLLLVFFCWLTPSPHYHFPPPPPPYNPRNYLAVPGSTTSLLLPALVYKDKEDDPRRKRK